MHLGQAILSSGEVASLMKEGGLWWLPEVCLKILFSSTRWGGDWVASTPTPGQPTFPPQLYEQGQAQCLTGMVSHTLGMSQASNPPKTGKVDRGGYCGRFHILPLFPSFDFIFIRQGVSQQGSAMGTLH